MSDIKHQFRSGTRDLHKELDSLHELEVLKGHNLNSATYAKALTSLYYPHWFLEQTACEGINALRISYRYSMRSTLLEEDLCGMGVLVETLDVQKPLKPTQISSLPSLPQIIGYLYLLEGSKLGSAHISKLISKKTTKDLPKSFFSSALSTSFSFETFWQFAEANLENKESIDAAVVAAKTAFKFYIESIRTKNLQTHWLV